MAGWVPQTSATTLQQMQQGSSFAPGIELGLSMLAQKRKQKVAEQEAANRQEARELENEQRTIAIAAANEKARLKKKAMTMSPPEDDASAKEWRKYARVQEHGGLSDSSKRAFNYADILASGKPMPDMFKSYPEVAKLMVLRDQKGVTPEKRAELDARINKLITIKPPKPDKTRLESSGMTAKQLASSLDLAGVSVEGQEALVLGDLSRSLTQKLERQYDITQSDVNDTIAKAYKYLLEAAEKKQSWYDFSDVAPTKNQVEELATGLIDGSISEESLRAPKKTTATPKVEKRVDLLNRYPGN